MRELHDEYMYQAASRALVERFAAVFPGNTTAVLFKTMARCEGYRRHLELFDFVVLGGGGVLSDQQVCEAERAEGLGIPVFLFGSAGNPTDPPSEAAVGKIKRFRFGGFQSEGAKAALGGSLPVLGPPSVLLASWNLRERFEAGPSSVITALQETQQAHPGVPVVLFLWSQPLAEDSGVAMAKALGELSEAHMILLVPMRPFDDIIPLKSLPSHFTGVTAREGRIRLMTHVPTPALLLRALRTPQFGIKLVVAGDYYGTGIGLGLATGTPLLTTACTREMVDIAAREAGKEVNRLCHGRAIYEPQTIVETMRGAMRGGSAASAAMESRLVLSRSTLIDRYRRSLDGFVRAVGDLAKGIVVPVASTGGAPRRMRAVYIGNVGYKNAGDELVYDVCVRAAVQSFARRGVALSVENSQPLCTTMERDFSEFDFLLLGGGSLVRSLELCQVGHATRIGLPVFACGTGYEDLETLWPAHVLDQARGTPDLAKAKEVVWPQLTQGDRRWGKALSRVRFGGYRGHLTRAVVGALGGPVEEVLPIGDPGLLFGIEGLFSEASRGAAGRAADRVLGETGLDRSLPLIMVSWASATSMVYGGDPKALSAAVAKVLAELTGRYAVLLYPLWLHFDEESVSEMESLIRKAIPQQRGKGREQSGRLGVLRQVEDAPVLVELMRRAHFTVGLRLHGNVLSAAAGTPFVSLAYRLKSFDFADSIGMGEFTLRTDTVIQERNALRERIEALLGRRDEIKATLLAATQRCLQAFEAQFSRLLDHLE